MIPGTPVQMNGKEWIIPPLTLRQRQELDPALQIIKESTAAGDTSAMTAIAEIILAAMQRNYPELTTEKVLDLLDMGNLAAALNATMQAPTLGGTPVTSAAPRPLLSLIRQSQ